MTGNQKYKYPEGDVYEGDWSKEGKKHGIGRLILTDGTEYEGRFHHGLFHGYGSLRLPDSTTYEGEFTNGMFNGFGVYTRCDGMMYEGGFKNGNPYGPGMVTFPDGSNGDPRQEGYFEGTKLVRRENVPQYIKKAQTCQERALSTTLTSN